LPDRRQKRLVFQASFFCISLCYNSIYAIIITCQCHCSMFIAVLLNIRYSAGIPLLRIGILALRYESRYEILISLCWKYRRFTDIAV
jgi:hypothetical protein